MLTRSPRHLALVATLALALCTLISAPLFAAAAEPTGVDQTLFPDKDGQTVSSNSNNKGALKTMRIGFDTEDKGEYRILIHFDLASLKKQPVFQALLRIHSIDGHHGNAPMFIRIHPLYRDWDEAKFLWTGPSATEAWFKEGGDVLLQACGGGKVPAGYSGTALDLWYNFDITDCVRKWQAGTLKNYGVEIMCETGSDIWITYDSKEADNHRPCLLVSYGAAIGVSDATGVLSGTGIADLPGPAPIFNPVILNTEMKRAFTELAYEDTLRVRGGEKPYKFEFVGAAPAGFSLDPETGKVTGSPTKAGNQMFRIKVTGSDKKFSTANLKMVIEQSQGGAAAAATGAKPGPGDPAVKPG
ncbi:MAG TPA: DNRLRE domain-containing protein, partial [Planctomycetota bacterium]|nr:DNRLRE domain-containing protein [Planctomycetota bacterium]